MPATASSTSSTATAISGHELLGAHERPGPFGGSLENRTRFMREIIDGIRAAVPGLSIVVRLSAFDVVPHRKGADGAGTPAIDPNDYHSGFGVISNGDLDAALDEAQAGAADARGSRRAVGLRHRRQPVLLPARAAAGPVSPERRLRAT